MGDKWALIPLPGVETPPDADDKKDPTFWQTHDAFPLKYLPDPLARQAVLRNLPGPAENVVTEHPVQRRLARPAAVPAQAQGHPGRGDTQSTPLATGCGGSPRRPE